MWTVTSWARAPTKQREDGIQTKRMSCGQNCWSCELEIANVWQLRFANENNQLISHYFYNKENMKHTNGIQVDPVHFVCVLQLYEDSDSPFVGATAQGSWHSDSVSPQELCHRNSGVLPLKHHPTWTSEESVKYWSEIKMCVFVLSRIPSAPSESP